MASKASDGAGEGSVWRIALGLLLGLGQVTVIERYGNPEDAQKVGRQSFYGSGTDKFSRIHCNESGKGLFEGSSFQLCFTNGVLDSKNAY